MKNKSRKETVPSLRTDNRVAGKKRLVKKRLGKVTLKKEPKATLQDKINWKGEWKSKEMQNQAYELMKKHGMIWIDKPFDKTIDYVGMYYDTLSHRALHEKSNGGAMAKGGEISDSELKEFEKLSAYKKALRGQESLDFTHQKTANSKRYHELLEKYMRSEQFSKDLGIKAKGGEVENKGIDLFEDYKNIPAKVQKVLDKYEEGFQDGDYNILAKAKEELEAIGYTFEYYLDGQAYDLRKIGEMGKVEYAEKHYIGIMGDERFEPFAKIIKKSDNFEDAFNEIKKMGEVSGDVTDAFDEKYNPTGKLSLKEAFRNFYDEIKDTSMAKGGEVSGKYKLIFKGLSPIIIKATSAEEADETYRTMTSEEAKRLGINSDLYEGIDPDRIEKMAKGGDIKGKVEVGETLYATTGVPVKVLEYDPLFGGRVRLERADGYEDEWTRKATRIWKPLSKFSRTNPMESKAKGGDVSYKPTIEVGKLYRNASGNHFLVLNKFEDTVVGGDAYRAVHVEGYLDAKKRPLVNPYRKFQPNERGLVVETNENVIKNLSKVLEIIKADSGTLKEIGGGVGELEVLENKIKEAFKVTNKWHFIGGTVNGSDIKMKFFIGQKEVDTQIFKIDGIDHSGSIPSSGKKDAYNAIIDVLDKKFKKESSMAKGGKADDLEFKIVYEKDGEKKIERIKAYSWSNAKEIAESKGKFIDVQYIEKAGDLSYYHANGGSMAKGGELNGLYDLRVGLGNESMDEKISRAIRDLFHRQNGELDKKVMDKTISALSKHTPHYAKAWKSYQETFEIKEENGKYVNPFSMAKGGKFKTKYEFYNGDVVWDLANASYGVVLNNFDNPTNGEGGEIRLDSDGVQSIFKYDKNSEPIGYNLVPYGSKEDKGDGDLSKLKAGAKKLIESNKDYSEERYKFYSLIYCRLLSGDIDKKSEGGSMAKGGSVSPSKAKMILHDNKAHGKTLSDKQRRYFGARASGYPDKSKSHGGEMAKGGKTKKRLKKVSEKKSKPVSKKKDNSDKSGKEWDEVALIELREYEGDDSIVNLDHPHMDKGFEAENKSRSSIWYVFENESDAKDYAIERVKEDLENEPEIFNQDWLLGQIDKEQAEKWFRSAYDEWNNSYAYDIKSEKATGYTNRLAEEMYERGIITEEQAQDEDFDLDSKVYDFVEDMTQGMIDEGNGGYDHYKDNFGDDQAKKVIFDNNLIDIDEASENAVDEDGIAHFIGRYDGKQIDLPSGAVAYKN